RGCMRRADRGTRLDYVPQANVDLEEIMADRKPVMQRLKNGFWYAHSEFDSKSRVHYGSAYDLPDELGRFDVATMCAVLLHNRDPLKIIENCCARADTVVIADMIDESTKGGP